ncbi:MAG: DUF2764 family protein [Planctomycetota bacterium]|jgi:hypothetical protein
MASDKEYLLASLPVMADLGDPAPMSPAEMLAHVADFPAPAELVRAIFLADDLLQRDTALAGELAEPTPVVLTPEQLRDEAPLPTYLVDPDVTPAQRYRIAGDSVWAGYFRYAADVARRRGSQFLRQWVGFDVALRNALAEARAKALGLTAEEYLVAADLADETANVEPMVDAWSAARTPLAALRVLDNARWRWLDDHDRWFSFTDDELAAYAARIMLLERWHRLTLAQEADSAEPTTA